MRKCVVLLSLSLLFPVAIAAAQPNAADRLPETWDEAVQGPMPRWRLGGTPPVDPNQSLVPYAVTGTAALSSPTSGYIESPPEYAPCAGVIFRYSTSAWSDVVTDCVVALTADPLHDEIAWVVVSSAGQQSSATSQFTAGGADMGKVRFFVLPNNSIWLRDYGPHFIWQSGTLSLVDSHYYPTRPLDNFIPTLIGDDRFRFPTWDIGLYYSGGNFQPSADRVGYITSLIYQDNPTHGEPLIAELFQAYQGLDTTHIFPRLPSSVDGTGHIDMWFYMVDEDTVIISEFLPGENATAITITDNAAVYMQSIGYEVFRVPDHNGYNPSDPNCHYTYTNAYRVNDRIFIPTYGEGNATHLARDAEALAVWQAAAPEAEIVPIDCYGIIWAAGAIHCIVMQVPRYTDTAPSAHVVSPDGDELLIAGTTHDLTWVATDDVRVTEVDIAYSTDGGATFPHVIATGAPNTGHHDWVVPATLTNQAVVRVTARDADGNVDSAQSEGVLSISAAAQHLYDFSTAAGIDKWAWGNQTITWSAVQGTRYPVVAEITASNYASIAASDASGGDSDTNRYRSSFPTSGWESTHVFEFALNEDPALMLDIGILWEGYGDDCTQVEMYVWDDTRGDWSDGGGMFGENRFLDNFAGNRDETLDGHIRGDFNRYVDGNGLLTLLMYAERSSDRSFHDYVAVTVTHTTSGDLNGDGLVGIQDFLQLLGEWGPCPAPPAGCPGDLDGDGVVGILDFLILLGNWG